MTTNDQNPHHIAPTSITPEMVEEYLNEERVIKLHNYCGSKWKFEVVNHDRLLTSDDCKDLLGLDEEFDPAVDLDKDTHFKHNKQPMHFKNNVHNRVISEDRVKRYKQEMEDGLWCPTGEPALIDDEGQIISFGHRATAAMLADMEGIPFLIMEGLPPEFAAKTDVGRNRDTKDGAVRMGIIKDSHLMALCDVDEEGKPIFDSKQGNTRQTACRQLTSVARNIYNRAAGQDINSNGTFTDNTFHATLQMYPALKDIYLHVWQYEYATKCFNSKASVSPALVATVAALGAAVNSDDVCNTAGRADGHGVDFTTKTNTDYMEVAKDWVSTLAQAINGLDDVVSISRTIKDKEHSLEQIVNRVRSQDRDPNEREQEQIERFEEDIVELQKSVDSVSNPLSQLAEFLKAEHTKKYTSLPSQNVAKLGVLVKSMDSWLEKGKDHIQTRDGDFGLSPSDDYPKKGNVTLRYPMLGGLDCGRRVKERATSTED